MKWMKIFVGAMVAGCLVAPLFSEVTNDIEITRSMIKTKKKAIVSDVMGLDPETAKKFWPVYNDYQNDQRKVNDRLVELLRDIAEDYEELTDEKAKSILNRWMKHEDDSLKLKKRYIRKFNQAVSPKTTVLFFQTENKLESIINFGLASEVPFIE